MPSSGRQGRSGATVQEGQGLVSSALAPQTPGQGTCSAHKVILPLSLRMVQGDSGFSPKTHPPPLGGSEEPRRCQQRPPPAFRQAQRPFSAPPYS